MFQVIINHYFTVKIFFKFLSSMDICEKNLYYIHLKKRFCIYTKKAT